ncbi:ORF1304 [White spot syndrome virus]|uniref:ORF1304 n=1 Tax=White spot syndrome virus TaxID=342409 RepID=A0A0S2E6I9_9VIRU|nr:hypothetical protein [White spot syndrome virus]ATU83465.1 ORF1304 [White spot syndrome virus]AYW76661.1 hypothetical protein [Procambarus clarkii virus]WUY11686.1 hypothetical protein [White spot syndrome virus]WUY11859.1 hypothetical protein [White spot syndrome virus]
MFVFVEGSPLTGKTSWVDNMRTAGKGKHSFLNFMYTNYRDYLPIFPWTIQEHLRASDYQERPRLVDGMFGSSLNFFTGMWRHDTEQFPESKIGLREYLEMYGEEFKACVAEWVKYKPVFHVMVYREEDVKKMEPIIQELNDAHNWFIDVLKEERALFVKIEVIPRNVYKGNICSSCFSTSKNYVYRVGKCTNSIVHCDMKCKFIAEKII